MNRIAIVGGGIAGITCAIALQKRGFYVDVFEQTPQFKEVGAVLAVTPNGMSVLKDLGIFDKVLDQGGIFNEFRLLNQKGRVIRKSFFNYPLPAVIVKRSDLLNNLLSAVDPVCLRPDHALTDYSITTGDQVALTFSNQPQVIADALIAADGIHSVVRNKLIKDGQPIYRGYSVWRGVGGLSSTPGYCAETWAAKARFGFYPIKGGEIGWWAAAVEDKGTTDEPEGRHEKLLRIFGNWPQPIKQIIESTPVIIKNDIGDRKPVKNWYSNQIVLIGDAAHCSTPNLGQGANIAMEGALLLARCIEKYGLNTKSFQVYENLHFGRTKDIISKSLLVGKIGQLSNPVLMMLRDYFYQKIPLRLAMKPFDKHYNYNVSTLPLP